MHAFAYYIPTSSASYFNERRFNNTRKKWRWIKIKKIIRSNNRWLGDDEKKKIAKIETDLGIRAKLYVFQWRRCGFRERRPFCCSCAWLVTSRRAFTNLHRAPTLAAPPLSWRRPSTHYILYTYGDQCCLVSHVIIACARVLNLQIISMISIHAQMNNS